jgi:hypothetical protein
MDPGVFWTVVRESFWVRVAAGLVLTLGFAMAVGLLLGSGSGSDFYP